MARKVLLVCMAAALALAGCTAVRETPLPATPASVAPTPKPAPTRAATTAKPKPRSTPRTATRPATSPAPTRADLPAMIGSGAKWTVPGRALAVKSGNATTQQPVPIFRQAGTLATVRAALADSPARPQAEFRNGVLTLNFPQGSNQEIAEAVNRTLSVAGTRNLQVTLQP